MVLVSTCARARSSVRPRDPLSTHTRRRSRPARFGQISRELFGPLQAHVGHMPDFDPLEPFENKELLRNVLDWLEQFEYKLYGRIPLKFHRGEPTRYEFDLNLGVVYITEQDCKGLGEILAAVSESWGSKLMF